MCGRMHSVTVFTKTNQGRHIYANQKETIERSFAATKENHGPRYARILEIENMQEQCFLTTAVQNIKRLTVSLGFFFLCPHSCI